MNVKIKKIIAIVLTGALCIGAMGCNVNNANAASQGDKNNTNNETTKVKDQMSVTFLDVDYEDAALVQLGDKTLLIDAGDETSSGKVVKYIKSLGIKKIDYVVVSEYYKSNGMLEVVKNFPIGELYVPETSKSLDGIELDNKKELDANISAETVKRELKSGDEIPIGDAKLKVILGDISNSRKGIVSKLIYGDTTFLFCGDLFDNAPNALIATGETKADVYKIPGVRYNDTNKELTKAVDPQIAIASMGTKYSVDEDIFTTLDGRGAKVYKTCDSGNIVVKSDGEKVTTETQGK